MDACPLPQPAPEEEEQIIRRMLKGKRIAVVGMSHDPSRASHFVAQYLKSAGYEIIPVNPAYEDVSGMRCYPNLREVPGKIDIVDVFRRPEFCAAVAKNAVEIGARGIWLQSGITSAEARQIAAEAGVDYIENRCLKVEHMMHRHRGI
jgi:predicted CoA-binding protein